MKQVVKRAVGSKTKCFWQRSFFGMLLLAVTFGGLPLPVQAASAMDHLYEVSLLVADQGDAERQRALREGLESIIVRMSGQTNVGQNVVIRQAMGNPDPYLQQFAYASLTEAEKTELRVAANMNKSRLAIPTVRINLSFSPEPVKTLLRQAQLPIWPATRPSVLVWVVIDGGSMGKRLLSRADPAQGFLIKEASRRGLPIVLPMNDLKDQVISGVNRLWELDQAAITEASQRYGEDSVLVGKVSQTSIGGWQGSWLYLLQGQSSLVEVQGDDLESFLGRGLDEVIRLQVQRYSISPDSSLSQVSLVISGVDSLQAYANTLLFLKSLEMVKTLQVVGVSDSVLECALQINGNSQVLSELIALDRVLVREDGLVVDRQGEQPPASLRYRLSGK